MSGGYAPLAAVIMQDSIHQAFFGGSPGAAGVPPRPYYGGDPLACTAGLATLDYILEHDVLAAVKQRGVYLAARLEELHRQFPFVGEPRGVGLLQGFDFVRDRATNARSRRSPARDVSSRKAGKSGASSPAAGRTSSSLRLP